MFWNGAKSLAVRSRRLLARPYEHRRLLMEEEVPNLEDGAGLCYQSIHLFGL